MVKRFFEIIEAARALQIVICPTEANPHGIKVGCSRQEFPERLWLLAKAIEAFDAETAAVHGRAGDVVPDPAMDAARLRVALDGVFRWMRSNGMDISEPYAMVATALGVERHPDSKPGKGYKPVPRYAHNGFKRPVGSGPLLNLGVAPRESVTFAKLAENELKASMTEVTLGAAAPTRTKR